MQKGRVKWTQELLEQFIDLYTKGVKTSEISNIMNICPRKLSLKAGKLGINGPNLHENIIFPNLTEKDKAYIGGIIDGEGNIQILIYNKNHKRHKKISHLPQLKITNTNPKLILYLKDKLGVGNLYYQLKPEPRRTDYIINISGGKCIAVIKELKEFIFIKKREAEIILEFAELKSTRRNYKLTDDIYNKRIELEKELKLLHHTKYPLHPLFIR